MGSSQQIKLLVLDIDGVLTGGEGNPLDFALLGILAGMNKMARANSSCPAVTVCSGRPAPYVELMTQALDGHQPAIFENGAGLYFPTAYSFRWNPALQDGQLMKEVRQLLQAGLVDTGQAFFQPGKERTLTLYPLDSMEKEKLLEEVTRALGAFATKVDILTSPNCVNILPPGMDKSSGIRFLAEQTGLDPACMLGVGDSDIDLSFLRLVGHSAAPANANPGVKAVVGYVSGRSYGQGLRDIIAHFGITC